MIQKIDSAKIFILESFGGIMADMDMEVVRPVSDLLTASIVFSKCYVHPTGVAIAKVLGLKNFSKTTINNGFIACTANHPVMKRTISLMRRSALLPNNTVYGIYIAKTCGTEILIEGLFQVDRENPVNYKIYNSDFFEPKIKMKDKEPLITRNTHVIHHTDRTWIKDSPVAQIQTSIFYAIIGIVIGLVCLSVGIISFKYAKRLRLQ
jgi:mannosyltransferase OCH1-like enzyme